MCRPTPSSAHLQRVSTHHHAHFKRAAITCNEIKSKSYESSRQNCGEKMAVQPRVDGGHFPLPRSHPCHLEAGCKPRYMAPRGALSARSGRPFLLLLLLAAPAAAAAAAATLLAGRVPVRLILQHIKHVALRKLREGGRRVAGGLRTLRCRRASGGERPQESQHNRPQHAIQPQVT